MNILQKLKLICSEKSMNIENNFNDYSYEDCISFLITIGCSYSEINKLIIKTQLS